MFNSLFDTAATGLDIKTALICAGASLLLGLAIAITHMKTSQTTKGFLTTLAVLPLLVMAVMIMINGNLGTSIAILGAFSLIRFRSIQGHAKDLLSVFFAMMIDSFVEWLAPRGQCCDGKFAAMEIGKGGFGWLQREADLLAVAFGFGG